MSFDFHDPKNKQMYTERSVDTAWKELIEALIDPILTACAIDLGCGGGIYTRELHALGFDKVIGLDFSEQMLEAAKNHCSNLDGITFRLGTVDNTQMEDKTADLILQRAVIHHLEDLDGSFSEAFRLLKRNGLFIVQDRTPNDCLLQGSPEHIRGYFFSEFPHLAKKEIQRRHSSGTVVRELGNAGFSSIHEMKLWETRGKHANATELLSDIASRKGRSILHELTDNEMEKLTSHIASQLGDMDGEITEKDRWTLWTARKQL